MPLGLLEDIARHIVTVLVEANAGEVGLFPGVAITVFTGWSLEKFAKSFNFRLASERIDSLSQGPVWEKG